MQLFIETTALSSQWYEKRLFPRMPEVFIQIQEPTPLFSCRRQCNHSTTQAGSHDNSLVLHGRRPPLAGLVVCGLGVVDALGKDLSVLVLYWH